MEALRRYRLVLVLCGLVNARLLAAQDSSIIDAVRRGDTAKVQSLVRARSVVDALDADGASGLHLAIASGNTAVARILLEAGANPNLRTRFGVAPLLVACSSGHGALVDLLLQYQADANSAQPFGEPPLTACSRVGAVDAIESLIKHGADVNAASTPDGYTALMWAAAEQHPAVVTRLLKHGADLHRKSASKLTAAAFAVRIGDIDTVRALLDGGVDVNDVCNGSSLLSISIVNGHYDLSAFLLERGAYANSQDADGTPLQTLAWMRRPGYLSWVGGSPADPIGSMSRIDSLDLARLLLDRGANPNARVSAWEEQYNYRVGMMRTPPNVAVARTFVSFLGATPFWLAAKYGDVPYMQLLLSHSADPHIPNLQQVTPLMVAAGFGWQDGDTPSEPEALESVKLLLSLGADVNVAMVDTINGKLDVSTDMNNGLGWAGGTAVIGAAQRGADSILKLLVEHGASLDVKTERGFTPLSVAEGITIANVFRARPTTVALIKELQRR